jgi:hypothetical protein
MPSQPKTSVKSGATRKPPHASPRQPSRKPAAAQAAAALRVLAAKGLLTGQADKISARIDHGLLEAAARKIGSTNTTEVVEAALAAFVAPDPFVEWLLSDRDRLPPDFELAI